MDLFTVPTATFRVLYVLVMLRHDRRRILHFNVTDNPTDAWMARQILEAFPWSVEASILLRDRGAVFGAQFRATLKAIGPQDRSVAARSPWQNGHVERLIGSIRRECLDHVIVLGERHLRRVLQDYITYYHQTRTHLSLGKDAPHPRAVHGPDLGEIRAVPKVGGLHHLYVRGAA